MNASQNAGATTEYEILVKGELSEELAERLDARRCEARHGETLILVDVIDQSHLHGVIERLRDLNVEIESVSRV